MEKNSYMVFYNKYPFNPIGEITAEALAERYVPLMQVEANNLEEVFCKMQGEEWSPNGEARKIITDFGLSHTSIMVSDIIYSFENKRFYIVEMIGFEELPLTIEW